MNTREFNIFEGNKLSVDNFLTGLTIIKTIISDIDIILRDYELAQDEIQEINKKREKISEIYKKYNNLFSKKRILQEINALNYKRNTYR